MTLALPPGIQTYKTTSTNWTCPDNVWSNNQPDSPITICDVNPSIHPLLANHLPISLVLDLSICRAIIPLKLDMFFADFSSINAKLVECLAQRCLAKEPRTKEKLEVAVDSLVKSIQETLAQEVLLTKPCPYMKCWWSNELSDLKKVKNRLSKLAHRFRGTPDHPAHFDHREAAQKLHNCINTTKKNHWVKWLEDATIMDIYMANKYIHSDTTDFSNTHIPNLQVSDPMGNIPVTVSDNAAKAKVLVKMFFPPPPASPTIPATADPKPLPARGIFTRIDIRKAIKNLKPNKAPGPDGIKNIVIQQCADTIIDNLFFIFCAILKLNTYTTQWLNILTIVLRKPRKPAYNVAKAYWPIGLLDTLGKLFSTLIADDISYLTEKHQLLLPMQFGRHPGHCTTDAMHIVTQKIKDIWRQKKVALILFLDIQATFPNTVKE